MRDHRPVSAPLLTISIPTRLVAHIVTASDVDGALNRHVSGVRSWMSEVVCIDKCGVSLLVNRPTDSIQTPGSTISHFTDAGILFSSEQNDPLYGPAVASVVVCVSVYSEN